MMKITFSKEDKQYHLTYSVMDSAAWLCTEEGEGMGMSQDTLDKLHDGIFNAIDEFFNKHI